MQFLKRFKDQESWMVDYQNNEHGFWVVNDPSFPVSLATLFYQALVQFCVSYTKGGLRG